MKKKILMIFMLFMYLSQQAFCQELTLDTIVTNKDLKFRYSSLIIPAALISYGVIGIESDGVKDANLEIKEEVNENIDRKITIDDFSQYAPTLAVYGLNAVGIKGKNNFRDRTVILATSFAIMSTTVLSLKNITKIERPDGSTKNSFPSGHTATAFMGAEFLMQEYKDVSIWYGVSGYVVAAGTGFFRIYNDRHWLTDVAAGAGIGILSTKIAYWINPFINEKLFRNKKAKHINSLAYPYYNGNQVGLNLSFNF
ncbi:phosphatase PAP2 family protein [Carboxylicivirga linearis]|uniref:Phosphatase PAP2 family protein n=1 Tax=Carboxylicivirga linearis TaxID=1628157 RepID=A0ABS5K1F7_9BACT|nr:phosphatase PAP2 family protein [Carboxylicivirga linearis]MBS2100964.1 phosphatase PAP2 family protein [Carboxylicivirga linearis]